MYKKNDRSINSSGYFLNYGLKISALFPFWLSGIRTKKKDSLSDELPVETNEQACCQEISILLKQQRLFVDHKKPLLYSSLLLSLTGHNK